MSFRLGHIQVFLLLRTMELEEDVWDTVVGLGSILTYASCEVGGRESIWFFEVYFPLMKVNESFSLTMFRVTDCDVICILGSCCHRMRKLFWIPMLLRRSGILSI